MRARFLAIAFLASAVGGCAFMDPHNTPLLTALDKSMRPKTTGEKIAYGPVFVPVGVVCGVLDVCLVHPAQAAVLAGKDTWNLMWAKSRGSFTEQCLEFLPKAAVTPVLFAFSWVGRSLFDVRRLRPTPDAAEPPRARRPADLALRFAFSNRRNRVLVNCCEKVLVPENAAAKWAMAPIILPVGLAAGVVDTLLVHPASVVDDTWLDAKSLLWEPTDRGYVTECAVLPVRAILTPPVLAWFFASRTVFDTPPWPPAPDRLEEQLLDEDAEMRMLAAQALRRGSYRGKLVEPATAAMLKACRAHKDDVTFCETVIELFPRPLTDGAQAYLRELALTGKGRPCAAGIKRLFRDTLYRPRYAGDKKLSPRANAQRGNRMRVEHLRRSVNFLAATYDDLVKAGHHEAEVYLTALASFKLWEPGPKALGLYITRSLARREWPAYAQAVGFRMQVGLLNYTPAGRIAAVQHEWRVLRVQRKWPDEVAGALEGLGRKGALEEQLYLKAALEAQDELYRRKIGRAGPGKALELLVWTERLADIKTMLDAAEVAGELWKSKSDRDIFMGDPLTVLIKKGGR